MAENPFKEFPRAGFFRRLGAMIYDFLIVMAIYMVAGALAMLFVVVLEKFGAISLEGYQDTADYLGAQPWFTFFLVVCICSFYVWFWSHGGQTIGMRAWRLRVQNDDGTAITLMQAIIRLFSAAMGIGNLLVIMDRKQKLALQDHMADCEVIVLSKEANQFRNWQTP
ncbi:MULTISPECIES: RDD family protein [Corallincola]|uniref:RDD family protein n=3 Tax=Corallincola TaxID=1775176 RepID=A0A368NQL2_9GAMM|nr:MULTISPECIES: RDD family protein [Corallincola]RCU51769.1 RDD family protein [Corallincola holothuriorum]TAA47259.1 RDD family protein [Corallincola spongiicola]TCI04922.1 RDD family protein [Corallincola luteus]